MTNEERLITNDQGDVLCKNCRRYVPVAYDANFCVFGRHSRKKPDEAVAKTDGESRPEGV